MMDITRQDLAKKYCLVALDKIFLLNLDDLLNHDIRRHVRHGKLYLSVQLLSILTTFGKPSKNICHFPYQLHLAISHLCRIVAQASSSH